MADMIYCVKDNIKAYLDQPTLGRPKDWDVVMRTWYVDEWNHLIDPPRWLTPAHYALCLRDCDDNKIKKMKFINAKSNLLMATMTHTGLSDRALFDIAMTIDNSNSMIISASGDVRKVDEPMSHILKDIKIFESTPNYAEWHLSTKMIEIAALVEKMQSVCNNFTQKDPREAGHGVKEVPQTSALSDYSQSGKPRVCPTGYEAEIALDETPLEGTTEPIWQ